MQDGLPTLREMLANFASGARTSLDYTRECLSRIERFEPRVAAWAYLAPARAEACAREADTRRAQGATSSLLGIPIGVKDIMHVRGLPTGMGSAAFAGFVPAESATLVQRLEAAGAFVLGKTVTAELAYYTPGKTRNPWNPAHTPGGSSSGSAAAVAAGMIPAALGTQTNGSVIRPAAFCGVVGYKPSAGLIPCQGVFEFSRTLDQVGVFARNLEDAALVAAALIGPDDDAAPPPGVAAFTLDPGVRALGRPPRLVAVRSPVWPLAEPAQQKQFETDIARLRAAGAEVAARELPADFERGHGMLRTIMYYEGARALQDVQRNHRDKLSAVLNRLIDDGLAMEEPEYRAALDGRRQLQAGLAGFLRQVDAIITPPARGEAPATLDNTGDPAFCTLWTLCGVPALAIPTGLGPQGLPLGLQIVGALRDDARMLAVAQWCAGRLRFAGRPPE
jgi:Asp-tRNA(Asn)/Glu-tRNA(Gln) amidotransferase A subunit family amidase